jgi:alpha-D-ribose 1-methylphosphonate 5-triphosphate synthase subunit PhnL
LLRYKNIFNIKISSKGKIMISTLGKKTELNNTISDEIFEVKKKIQTYVANFCEE